MNKKVSSIVARLNDTLDGHPWFGMSVNATLDATGSNIANLRISNHPHTAVDLIYHMLTWTEFTLNRIKGETIHDMQQFESMDWREIDPQIHGWEEGVAAFRNANRLLLDSLAGKEDSWLDTKVDYREYTFDVLLNGLIEHHIYHSAQINFIGKSLG